MAVGSWSPISIWANARSLQDYNKLVRLRNVDGQTWDLKYNPVYTYPDDWVNPPIEWTVLSYDPATIIACPDYVAPL